MVTGMILVNLDGSSKVDLRSVKPGLSAAPLFMIHPKTGEMIVPLGWTKQGLPIWPVMGGAPEEGEDGDKDDNKEESEQDDEDDDSDEEDEEDDEDGEEDDDKGKGKNKNAQAKIAALTEEKDRHFRKFKKADKRAQLAEAELAALKAKYESGSKGDKDKGDKDKTPVVDDSKVKAAEAKAARLAVENAFLRVNEIDWVRPEQALALMQADDDYDIEFDDDGKVDRKSLRAELKRFAKANPHLVKPKPAAKDDEEDADEGTKGQRSTAPQMNGKRKGKGKTEPTRADLAKKFPALNRLSG